jgi:hypothetical protein
MQKLFIRLAAILVAAAVAIAIVSSQHGSQAPPVSHQENTSTNPIPTQNPNSATSTLELSYQKVTLGDLQRIDPEKSRSGGPLVESTGTIAGLTLNFLVLLKDAHGDFAILILDHKSETIASLQIGETVRFKGFYGLLLDKTDEVFAYPPPEFDLLPSKTPVVIPTEKIIVLSKSQLPQPTTWYPFFSFKDSKDPAVNGCEPARSTPLSPTGQHWKINWSVTNHNTDSVGDFLGSHLYVLFKQVRSATNLNNPKSMGTLVDTKVSSGETKSGEYNGAGTQSFLLEYQLCPGIEWSFTAEELR